MFNTLAVPWIPTGDLAGLSIQMRHWWSSDAPLSDDRCHSARVEQTLLQALRRWMIVDGEDSVEGGERQSALVLKVGSGGVIVEYNYLQASHGKRHTLWLTRGTLSDNSPPNSSLPNILSLTLTLTLTLTFFQNNEMLAPLYSSNENAGRAALGRM